MLRPLGQNKDLAALSVSIPYFGGNGGGTCLIDCKMPKHILNASLGGQINPREK